MRPFYPVPETQGDANRCFLEMEVMADSEEIKGFLDKARTSYQNYQFLFMQELQYLKADRRILNKDTSRKKKQQPMN